MKRIETFFALHILVAVAALSIGFSMTGGLLLALFTVLVGMFWFYSHMRKLYGLETFILLLFVFGSAMGYFWFLMPNYLPMIAVTAALGAWDLDHFLQRLKSVPRVEMGSGLGREHMRRLGLAELTGFLLGMVALTTRLQLSFWWGVALVLIVVIGLSRLVIYLRRELR